MRLDSFCDFGARSAYLLTNVQLKDTKAKCTNMHDTSQKASCQSQSNVTENILPTVGMS